MNPVLARLQQEQEHVVGAHAVADVDARAHHQPAGERLGEIVGAPFAPPDMLQ